jgi:hypothetical protein
MMMMMMMRISDSSSPLLHSASTFGPMLLIPGFDSVTGGTRTYSKKAMNVRRFVVHCSSQQASLANSTQAHKGKFERASLPASNPAIPVEGVDDSIRKASAVKKKLETEKVFGQFSRWQNVVFGENDSLFGVILLTISVAGPSQFLVLAT